MAAGGFYECLEKVCIKKEIDNGFVLVRPPGHHACRSEDMGFCYFNNAVVGINGLLKNYKNNPNCPKKILIVDWDVHHGNGTQNLTYDKENIVYFSMHRWGTGWNTFYPGTGKMEETGQSIAIATAKQDLEQVQLQQLQNSDSNSNSKLVDEYQSQEKKENTDSKDEKENKEESINTSVNNKKGGGGGALGSQGKNINVCLEKGWGDYEYLLIFSTILIPILKEFEPDLIVVSAGFDACIGDPLGGMNVTPPCFGTLTKLLIENSKCGHKNIVLLLEGGYNINTMSKAICCCVHSLLTTTTTTTTIANSNKENINNNNNNTDKKTDNKYLYNDENKQNAHANDSTHINIHTMESTTITKDNTKKSIKKNKKNKNINITYATPLLELKSVSDWKRKMKLVNELISNTNDNRIWNEKELELVEKSFGYQNEFLSCINKWSKDNNSATRFNFWLEMLSGGTSQIPQNVLNVQHVINIVQKLHTPFWQCYVNGK